MRNQNRNKEPVLDAMADRVLRHWQMVVYILTIAVGVGITLASVRQSEQRIGELSGRIKTVEDGSPIAKEAARHASELERRMRIMEERESSTRMLIERIDERVRNILERMNRELDKGTAKPSP